MHKGGNVAGLRRGDRVTVRPAGEILASLDDYGEQDGLPFMPEMLGLIGRSFDVVARADKTCNTVDLTGCSREMDATVHLTEVRCDGSAHGGCQAGCLLFFKESWLRPGRPGAESGSVADDTGRAEPDGAQEDADTARLRALVETRTSPQPEVYRCQATALPGATRPMTGLRHYLTDVRTRNVEPRMFARAMRIAFFDRYQRFSRRRLPQWLRFRGGVEQPDVRGTLKRTPVDDLGLMPGELVEVRSLDEIVATLNSNQRNRNLWFDREMIRYCGRRFRVLRRVNKLLDEKTGRMIETTTPSVILEGVVCVGDYHKLCPRRGYTYFREIWLKRVTEAGSGSAVEEAGVAR